MSIELSPISLCSIIFDKPFPYQADFLMSQSKRIAFRSGRQVGKTTICAVKAIHHAVIKEKRVVVILSPTQRQSSLMFRKVRAYCQHNILKPLIVQESQTMIMFNNGSEIHSLPGNNPDTIRGFSPTLLIIDEAAFVKDEVFVAAEPSLAATGGSMILTSTPFGKRGRFYNAFNPNSLYEKYHIPSKRCPLITEEFLNSEKAVKTELEFEQEYGGEFMEEMDTYFPRTLVMSVIDDFSFETDKKSHTNYYLGVDCARYGLDETVYIVIKQDNQDQLWAINIISTSKKPLTDIIGRVKDLHKTYGFTGIYIDSSGLGSGAVDSLIASNLPIKNIKVGRDPTPKYSDSVQFTLLNKEEIYKNLKLLMEQKRIHIPKHDKLINQLCDLQYEYTEAGHLKLHHPDDPRAHDDFPDALALAVAAFIKPRYRPYISTK